MGHSNQQNVIQGLNMRILVISSTVFRVPLTNYGGLEEIAWRCAKGLAEKGHEVSMIAPDGSTCPNVKMIHIGPAGWVDEKRAYGGFPNITEKRKNEKGEEVDVVLRPAHPGYWQLLPDYDVIIDHTWNKWALELKAEGRLKAPVLCVCHAPVNTMFDSMPNVEKACFVCISKDQASHFEALFNRSARVCYNGVDPDFYRPLGIPRSDRYLFLARFSFIKGAILAIDACLKAGVGLDLIGDCTITGEPEYLAACQAKADGKQIRIIGGVSRGETVYWYSQARAMIHAVKFFREPFGLAPIEAAMCGCPVIAWDNGAMRETMVPLGDKCGLVKSEEELVDQIKAVEYCHGNPGGFSSSNHNMYTAWVNKSQEKARQFSIDNMVSRYEQLCQEAISGGGW